MKFSNDIKPFLSLKDYTLEDLGNIEKFSTKEDFSKIIRVIKLITRQSLEETSEDNMNILKNFYNELSEFLSIRIGREEEFEIYIWEKMRVLKSVLKESRTLEDIIVFSKCTKEEIETLNENGGELPKFRYYDEICKKSQEERIK
jgi:hypothetical protein